MRYLLFFLLFPISTYSQFRKKIDTLTSIDRKIYAREKKETRPIYTDYQKKIVDIINAIPEVKSKNLEILKLSSGHRHLTVLPHGHENKDMVLYYVTVSEWNGDTYVPYYHLAVHSEVNTIIYAVDCKTNRYIPLTAYRKKYKLLESFAFNCY